MSNGRSTGFSLRRALIVSAALHFVAAALLVVGPRSSASSTGQGSGVSSEAVRVSTITIAFRPHAAAVKSAASAPVRSSTVVVKTARTPKKGVVSIAPAKLAHPAPARVAGAQALAHRASKAVVASASVARDEAGQRLDETTRERATNPNETGAGATAAPTPTQEKLAVPLVAPSPTATPLAETVALAQNHAPIDAPNGGWGQSAKPIVEDDDELVKLRAAAHASGKVSIEIDDRGNATRVTLPPSLSSDLRAELEKEFLAMHYLPAECNGLKCVGTLQLTL